LLVQDAHDLTPEAREPLDVVASMLDLTLGVELSKIAIVPFETSSWNMPQVPMPMNVVAPTQASASSAIAVDGQPIPVEQHVIGAPLYVPVWVTYSRFVATCGPSSHMLCDQRHAARSPGHGKYGATSPLSTCSGTAAAPERSYVLDRRSFLRMRLR
jgi:hypothetical protein